MKKPKLSKDTKKGLTFAGIVLCVCICAVCFLGDFKNFAVSFVKDNNPIDELLPSEALPQVSGIGEAVIGALDEATSTVVTPAVESEASETPVSAIKGTVVRVVDGDTYVLNINNEEVKVRLIGVDTPESVAPDTYRTENTQEGKDISEIVKEKITAGMTLSVEYDVSTTDRYGRHLAYLYFEDGTMVQEWLLNNGYANVATYPPNVKYSEHFAELAHKAYENKVGLWNGFFEYKA